MGIHYHGHHTELIIGIYPLKQFAPVIHENHRLRAASQWAKTPARIWGEETGKL